MTPDATSHDDTLFPLHFRVVISTEICFYYHSHTIHYCSKAKETKGQCSRVKIGHGCGDKGELRIDESGFAVFRQTNHSFSAAIS